MEITALTLDLTLYCACSDKDLYRVDVSNVTDG